MEDDYNWNLILKVAIPIVLIDGFLFYTNIGSLWKWISLVIASGLAGILVYINDKKRSNMFTSIGIVVLAALIVKFLKDFGFF